MYDASVKDPAEDSAARLDSLVDLLAGSIADRPFLEGVFVGGSLAAARADAFSDIDLGLVAPDERNERALWRAVVTLAAVPGVPQRTLERAWPGVRMLACLYSAADHPPLGLEVDLLVSTLANVGAQMPDGPSRVVFDRSGRLAAALAAVPAAPPAKEVEEQVRSRAAWFDFLEHDARVAAARGDLLGLAVQLGRMAEAIAESAALRSGGLTFGAKRAGLWLRSPETETVLDAMREPRAASVSALRQVFDRVSGPRPTGWTESAV